jgi:hypothetical protein
MNATVSTPVATVAAKLSAGDIAIARAALPGANVATLLKAVWSTRGFLRVNFGGAAAYGGLGLIKADLTGGILKALPGDYPAPYLLTPCPGGSILTPVEGWVEPGSESAGE